MSTIRDSQLVTGQSNVAEIVSLSLLLVAVVGFVGAWATIFNLVGASAALGGVTIFQLLGVVLLAVAIGQMGLGVASSYGAIRTTPSNSAGTVTGIVAGVLWATIGGLLAGQLVGVGLALSTFIALFCGVAGFLATVLPREDIGATLPIGIAVALVGGVIAGGLIDAGWFWSPGWTVAVFPGSEIVPLLVAASAVLGSWSTAKARAGFGAEGRQAGAFYLIGTVVVGLLSVLLLLIGFIIYRGLDTVSIAFLTNVTNGIYVTTPGVLPAILGTLWLVVGAVAFAVPLGVGAAVFLTEYAERGRFTQLVEIATNGLWSTPSIVFGLFGLAFLVPRLGGNRSVLAGQLVLGFMLLPLVLITCRESLKSVPDEYRDASAALGVSKWQTIRSVVLPAAMPGTITGVILGVGRIAGETAPLLLVFGGTPYPSQTPGILTSFQLTGTPPFVTNERLLEPASALPYQLYSTLNAGLPPGSYTKEAFGWGTALVLLIVVIGLYGIGVGSRLYFRRKLHQ
jgi:phosphate transport system permease protein